MFDSLNTLPFTRLTAIVHSAMVLITHRAMLGSEDDWSAHITSAFSSEEDARLVRDIVRKIEATEKVPLASITSDRAARYVNLLSDLVSARARKELKYDTAKAGRILHVLRERTIS